MDAKETPLGFGRPGLALGHIIWLGALTASLLAACGGGTDVAPPAVDGVAATPAADIRTLAFTLPQSYTPVFSVDLVSCASCAVYTVSDGSRGRLIDTRGHFAGGFQATAINPNVAFLSDVVQGVGDGESSSAAGVTPNGILVGRASGADGVESGFAVFSWTGETYFLPNHPVAFVSQTGLVGGSVCRYSGELFACFAFHWSPRDPALPPAEHPNFDAAWMNNPGRMIGYYGEPPGGPRQLATVDPDGTITLVPFDPGSGMTASPRYISDDGSLFVNTEASSEPAGSAVVISNGAVTPIGHGIATPPDVCRICDCIDSSAFRAFSATGHAVGVNTIHYLDPDQGWRVAAQAGFHWSAREGTTVIKVSTSDVIPGAVNAQGVVVGALAGGPSTSTSQEPFIWHRDSGGVLLRTLLPQPSSDPEVFPFIAVLGIGDAGHVLLRSASSDPLSPPSSSLSVFAPSPPVSVPGG